MYWKSYYNDPKRTNADIAIAQDFIIAGEDYEARLWQQLAQAEADIVHYGL